MIGYILWTLTNFGLLYEGNKSAWPVELTRSFEFLDGAEKDMLVFTPFLSMMLLNRGCFCACNQTSSLNLDDVEVVPNEHCSRAHVKICSNDLDL